MRRYIIEREIPGIGDSTAQQLCEGAKRSNAALEDVGPGVQWQQSYVAGDKTFCVYLADNEALILEHAERSGFPAHCITEVRTVFDPTTANC